MQNGGFVNKIQGVRLSVAKIHRHVFENPGCMGRGRLAPVIQAAFGKPVPVAAHPGGGAWINAAAVPMADGRADDHPEEISQAGGTAGIHGMTLYKTEKFSDGFPAEKNVLPYSRRTTLHTIKGLGMDADMLFLP